MAVTSSGELFFNTTTDNRQRDSRIAVLADGRVIVVWEFDEIDSLGVLRTQICARIYNADGSPAPTDRSSSDFIVAAPPPGYSYADADVVGLADGGYVVAWRGLNVAAHENDIRGLVTFVDGSSRDIEISTTSLGSNTTPSVAALEDGSFAVTWKTLEQAPGTYVNRGRVYEADGTPALRDGSDGEFILNATGSTHVASDPTVIGLPDVQSFVTKVEWDGVSVQTSVTSDVQGQPLSASMAAPVAASSISSQEIRDAAFLANAAYNTSDGLLTALSASFSHWVALGSEQLPNPSGLSDPEWNTYFGEGIGDSNYLFNNGNAQAFVAKNNTNESLAIAFRGTNNIYDLLQDLEGGLSSFFVEYEKFDLLVESLEQYIAENGITRVLVTGHSLGGVMAEWFMAAHSPGSSVDFLGITFGSPDDYALSGGDPRQINFGHTEDPVVNSSDNWVSDVSDVLVDLVYTSGQNQSNLGLLALASYSALTGDVAEHDMELRYTNSAYSISYSPAFSKYILDPRGYFVTIGSSDNATETMRARAGTNNFILGRGGNDVFYVGAGDDLIDGGPGYDGAAFAYNYEFYEIARIGGQIEVRGKAGIPALSGSDTLYGVEYLQFSDLVLSWNDPRIIDLSAGTAAGGEVYDGGSDPGGASNGNETDSAGALPVGSDIVGNDASEYLYGTAAGEAMYGNGGDDVLTGYAGQDSFDGGAGSDTVDYSYNPADVSGIVDLSVGTANYTASGFYVEQLSSIENIWMGAGDDVVIGDDGSNDLRGGPGNDTLQGGLGNDTIYGDWKYSEYGGNDTAVLGYTFGSGYTVSGTPDALHIVGSEGDDRYYNIEYLQFSDGSIKTAGELVGTPAKSAGEFQVNTFTVGDQVFSPSFVSPFSGYPNNRSIAVLSSGEFVVIWSSLDQDGSSYGIFGQRFLADGARAGAEFQVNEVVADMQIHASVGELNDGGFVVTWTTADPDNSNSEVVGQIFSADGSKVGGEFQINTTGAGYQSDSTVAGLSNGGFVVTWTSGSDQDGSQDGIFGQLYSSDGARVGEEFQINTYVSSIQDTSYVAGLSNGGFLVVWETYSKYSPPRCSEWVT